MGEAYLHNHGGMNFRGITAALGYNKYIAGDPSDNGTAVIYAQFGRGETVRLYSSECVFSPVTVSADTEYITISKTIQGITRSCSIPIVVYAIPGTFDNSTWDQIAVAARMGRAKDLWQVGDEKTEYFSGTKHTLRIIGFDHDHLAEEDEMFGNPEYNKGSGKAAISLQFKTSVGTIAMSPSATGYGATWVSTGMYKETLPALFESFPSALKNAVRLVDVLYYYNKLQSPYTTQSRITLIDPYIGAQSIRWIITDSSLFQTWYSFYRDKITPYPLFENGYVNSGDYEWTRGAVSYDSPHSPKFNTLRGSLGYSAVNVTSEFYYESRSYRPIFNI